MKQETITLGKKTAVAWMLICSGDNPWYKVNQKEAEGFEALLESLSE